LSKNHIHHRDIKPSNICINNEGDVKLIDFGTSTKNINTNDYNETLIGTRKYLAPEMLLKTRYIAEKSDIWALGITFYKLIFGKHPYLESEKCNEDEMTEIYYRFSKKKRKV